MPADRLDGAVDHDDAISPYMRRLGGEPSAEGERMRNRLAARMFGVSSSEPDRIGRFELRAKIGAGAMGVVYEAWDPELDRRVALKLLRDGPGRRIDPDSGKRLLREAKAMARLRHPNVVQVHEVGTHAGQVFVAMELIEGGSLRAWLAERERSWRTIVEVFEKAGRGLAAAHSAGLVHRDFKPDNVLIEHGRVFVGDFGLARSSDGESELELVAEPGDQPSASTVLTRTGAFVGTPAYMAPEAFDEASPDPRVDQYGFCASLYEALYGVRPWAGETVSQLRAAKARSLETPPTRARGRRLPRWLRRLVLRGLAPTPEQRFASMDALLLELQRGLRRSRWLRRDLWIGLGLASVTIASAWALGPGMSEAPAPAPALCSDSAQQLEIVWPTGAGRENGLTRRERVLAALGAGKLDYADELAARTVAAIDAHAQRWIGAHQRACEATHVRGEQSARALDLRMRCLDRRRSELDALLARFEAPGEADRLNSLKAVDELTPADACDDVELLESTTPLPEDPRVRAQVEQHRVELDAINAAIGTSAHAEVEARAVALLEAARTLGYKPLSAEAGVALGVIYSRVGKPKEAEPALEQAIVDAQASGHDEIAARAMISAIHVVGYQLRDGDRVERLIRQARALLEHIGDPPRWFALYTLNVGTVEYGRDNLERAREQFQQAIALYAALNGDAHPSVAEARVNLAAVERNLGNHDVAIALYERARADLEASLGPAHPGLFNVLNNMGAAYLVLGREAEAEAVLRQALELAAQTMPEKHASIGHAHNNLGELLVGQGHHLEARERFGEAIDRWTRSLGPDHPYVAQSLTGRGLARLELDDAAGAREDLERAFAIRDARGGSLRGLGETEFILARALAALGEPATEINGLAERALEHLGEEDGDFVTRAQVRAWLDAR
ncbi:MAG TPA: serine/threonine-protein kinase [Enhygromyxa sp.]|nr:serine/threonine-protein kinase [Enhygromyxa sp.]